HPSLAGERSMVRQCDLFFGERIDLGRDALRLPAIVDEDERGACAANALEQERIHRGPHGAAHVAEIGDRRDERRFDLLDETAVDDAARRLGLPISDEKPRDFVEWLLRRAESDALHASADLVLEALERECEMRAALRSGDGVNLVDDHCAERAEHPTTADARE